MECEKEKQEESLIEKEFRHLKSRIKSTRKSRIEASKRIRRKSDFYEKVMNFYSLIILILSIWFLNQDGNTGVIATKILLVLSLSLTFVTLFINSRNYKERASNFETNYQQLDVLVNRIDRFYAEGEDLSVAKLKEFQREYEKLIIGKENHTNIDFYVSTPENVKQFKNKIYMYNGKTVIKKFFIALFPIFLLVIIFVFSKVLGLFE
ncbi:SLATT domain-containing protein [Lysinibacillus boronitolerans]|nr:SLATT domain-containing protein [Lysinibacillus boronitolerans]